VKIEDHRVDRGLDQRDARRDRDFAGQQIDDAEPHREVERAVADGLQYVAHHDHLFKAALATYSYLKERDGNVKAGRKKGRLSSNCHKSVMEGFGARRAGLSPASGAGLEDGRGDGRNARGGTKPPKR